MRVTSICFQKKADFVSERKSFLKRNASLQEPKMSPRMLLLQEIIDLSLMICEYR